MCGAAEPPCVCVLLRTKAAERERPADHANAEPVEEGPQGSVLRKIDQMLEPAASRQDWALPTCMTCLLVSEEENLSAAEQHRGYSRYA